MINTIKVLFVILSLTIISSSANAVNLDLNQNDEFGSSISLDGNQLAVGSYYDDGYSSGLNINQSLEVSGEFGSSISLNGNQLAVGSYYDGNYLFSGGNFEATIGYKYTGAKNITIGNSDSFGVAPAPEPSSILLGLISLGSVIKLRKRQTV